jgi:hypothetical protein
MAGLAYSLPTARDLPGSLAARSGLPTGEGQVSLTAGQVSLTAGQVSLTAG